MRSSEETYIFLGVNTEGDISAVICLVINVGRHYRDKKVRAQVVTTSSKATLAP